MVVQELREIMADLGFRTINEMVGQVDSLTMKEDIRHWKYSKLDLSPILYKEPRSLYTGLFKQQEQEHELHKLLDWQLLELAKPALDQKDPVKATFNINNTDRAVGAILSNEISKKYGTGGLPHDAIHIKFKGTAGQSFAAFNTKGITMELEGDANDYFGKGLSGAKLIIYPPLQASFVPEENIIIGNVAFYGATSGEAYIRGKAGERFCVRNSGVKAVVEGVGDHGCEYMTGGCVVVLGDTGRNFAAGMSGGIAYVYDVKGSFTSMCNVDMIDLDQIAADEGEELRSMIQKHFDFTGSTVAKFILEDFENQIKNFIKVFPKDYKRVLQEQKQVLTRADIV
jgi:glutamate synthase (NADPH/NADH) large chain